MRKRPKLDPMSVLVSLRQKRSVPPVPIPLATIPSDEIAAFRTLYELLEQSKLMPYLDKKEFTEHGERVVCVNEDLVSQHYPGLNPLCNRLPGIDAFIYVYDGITGNASRKRRAKRDLRLYLGELGFRELLMEMAKACAIHRFCFENVHRDLIIVEPITKKPTSDARKDAFAIPARAKAVFQQIASRLRREIAALGNDPPQAYRDAYQFACDIQQALEPLARMGKQIRSNEIT